MRYTVNIIDNSNNIIKYYDVNNNNIAKAIKLIFLLLDNKSIVSFTVFSNDTSLPILLLFRNN